MRAWLPALALIALPAWAASNFAYTEKVGAGETAIIDTRPLAECKQATLPGARCLPVAELLAPQGQLPSERNLLWLFGTLGLTGEENVLVAGDSASGRDFIAGLLYLAGQRRVTVLKPPLSPQLAQRNDAAPGEVRGMVRSTVFTAPMRDELCIVNPREIVPGSITAPDAYTAIARFTRQVAGGTAAVRVGWNLDGGKASR